MKNIRPFSVHNCLSSESHVHERTFTTGHGLLFPRPRSIVHHTKGGGVTFSYRLRPFGCSRTQTQPFAAAEMIASPLRSGDVINPLREKLGLSTRLEDALTTKMTCEFASRKKSSILVLFRESNWFRNFKGPA